MGLAGGGWIAPFQVEGWRLIPETDVVAVCDRDLSRAQALAARFNLPWAGQDAERMMDDCCLDILDIATTPESHKDITLAAVRRGLHVLCQKPAAPNLADAEEMIRQAAARGVVLYINEMLRFCPWFRKIRELLQAGLIGRPVYARFFCRAAGFLETGPERTMIYGFREYFKHQPRLIVMEQTIHYFDVLRYLFGEPGSVYAVTGRVSPFVRGEDLITTVMKYAGMTAVIEDSWSAHGSERSGLEIEGLEGALFLSHAKVLEHYSGSDGKVVRRWDFTGKSWPEWRPLVFADLFADFLRLVAGGGDRTGQARDNLKSLRLTLAAYESSESAVEVKL